MSDSREEFEKFYIQYTGYQEGTSFEEASKYDENEPDELWEFWQASRQAVSVPEETLTAIHDTLRLVWSRELSADDGLDEIEILIPPASADVPEGWKIVPIYSTTEMDNAAREANYQMFIDRDHADAVWTAMIAASPCVSQSAESEPPKQEEDQ